MSETKDMTAAQMAELNRIINSKNNDGLSATEVGEIRASAKNLGVNANLAFSRLAVSVLRSQLGKVANWDENLDTSVEKVAANLRARLKPGEQLSPADIQLLERTEDAADKCVYGELRSEQTMQYIGRTGGVAGDQSLERIKHMAARSEHHKCGNCMEIAARVFMYLYAQNVRPIEYYHLEFPADHAFVVIGRPKNTPVAFYGYKPEQSDFWQEWTTNAVVCDPWALGRVKTVKGLSPDYGTSYFAINLNVVMTPIIPNFTYPLLDHREE